MFGGNSHVSTDNNKLLNTETAKDFQAQSSKSIERDILMMSYTCSKFRLCAVYLDTFIATLLNRRLKQTELFLLSKHVLAFGW